MSANAKIISGAVWRVGANIDTDALAPGHAMSKGLEVVAQHCLEAIRPDFSSGVRQGDYLVAGPAFGIGSSREQAASALVALGVSAVIAPSFSGLYFRNAFNVGLLLVTCARAEELVDADQLTLHVAPASGVALTSARLGELPCAPIPDFLIQRVLAGGLLNELKQRKSRENHG